MEGRGVRRLRRRAGTTVSGLIRLRRELELILGTRKN